MNKYIDYKHTAWSKIYFSDDIDMKAIADKIEKGQDIFNDIYDFYYDKFLNF
jgi:hypothetical protein